MKVIVLGGAGTQAQGVICDLATSPEVSEIVLADLEKTKDILGQRSKEWGRNKTRVAYVDVNNPENLRKVIRGCEVCAHVISHVFNLQIMDACLAEGCHYTDVGGLFHYYRKQVEHHQEWKNKGLTAVLGMGSAPGITNVLARYAADQLDTIESIHLRDGIANYAKSEFPLSVPYAIGTILQEFTDKCYIFTKGNWLEVDAFTQEETVDFSPPVGTMRIYATIHSEVASVPVSFKSKGIKEMSFKLGLPADFEQKMRFLAGIGLGSSQPLEVRGSKVSPIDFIAALAQTFPKPVGKPADYKCLRADAKGIKDGVVTEIQTEVMCHPSEEWNMKTGPYSVGVPVGIVCRMLGNGEITERGCLPAELCVPTNLFFKYLGQRNMHSTNRIKRPVA